MPQNFIPADRDQQLLLPPNLKEWLPANHLAFYVLDVVASFDLSRLYRRYRSDGWGRAAFEPQMMVALLVYAYAIGVRSSREIERRCVEDVAFRVIAANNRPDHATICRFRARFSEQLSELFDQVLRFCVSEGMVKVGTVALDGTKVGANASPTANRDADGIRALVDEIMAEADAVDRAEDELYGPDKRGDELPEHLSDPKGRKERLRHRVRELQEQERVLEQRAKERADKDRDAYDAAQAGKRRGRKPKPPDPKRYKSLKTNTTDPDSRIMKIPHGFLQAYNAQVVVTEDQIAIAADVVNDHNDYRQLGPMVNQASDNLARAGTKDSIGTVLADNGYMSDDNMGLDLDVKLLIAPVAGRRLKELEDHPAADDADERSHEDEVAAVIERAQRQAEIFDRVFRNEITMKQARHELGLSVPYTYALKDRYRDRGLEGLLPQRMPTPPPGPSGRARMLIEFSDPQTKQLYKRRAATVEPVFGQLKENLGLRRFVHRGLAACSSEWRLAVAAQNITKVWRRKRFSRSDPHPGFSSLRSSVA